MTALATTPTTPPAQGIPARRKLVPLSFVTVLTGWTEDEALARIESGELWPCWNLAVNPTRTRREIRVWREAAIRCRGTKPGKPAEKLESIITAALPMLGLTQPHKADIRAKELAYRFCVSDLHLVNLVRCGQLCECGKRANKTDSRRIAYTSAVELLTRRIL